LEGGWGIGEAEGHNGELEVAILAVEGGLGYVGGVDADLMISTFKVDLSKVLCVVKFIEEFVNMRERVTVFDGKFVEGTVVDAEAECAILFAGEEDGGAPRTGGRADVTEGKEIFESLL
jgi:hypothetical protein